MEDFKIDYHSVQEVISVVSDVLRMKNIGRNKGTNHEVDISCEDPGVKEEQDDLGDVGDTDTPREDIEGSEGSHGEITTKMSNAGDQSQPNSHAQFYSSLVKLRGLDLLLQKHTGNNEDKRGLIDSYLKEEDMSEHIVHGILSFIHQEFFFPSSPLKKAVLLRMKKAISLLVELMNKQVLHPVMKNSSNLCEDFLTQSFKYAIRTCSQKDLLNFFRIINSFGKNWALGSLYISLVLEEIRTAGELLLERSYQLGDLHQGSLHKFSLYSKLALSLLTYFDQTACQMIGLERDKSQELSIPKISLGDIRNFELRLTDWKLLLESTDLGVSQLDSELSSEVQKVEKAVKRIRGKIFEKPN